jgi:hypothetical protein
MKSIARRDLRSCIVSAITRASPARPWNNRILRLTSAAARAIAAPLLNATDAPAQSNETPVERITFPIDWSGRTVPNFVPRQNCARPWKRANAPHIMGMCGRTRLSTDYSETRIKLKFDPDYPAPNIPASWNVCPTDPMLVAVRSKDGKRIPQQMRWSLVPWWAKDVKVGFSSINARVETVATPPHFATLGRRVSAASSSPTGFMNGRNQRNSPTLLRWLTRATW